MNRDQKINFKWKEILKASVTLKFVKQLSDVYNFFLTLNSQK